VKIVVTGGSGFMGSHLVDALCGREHEVVVFDHRASTSLPRGARMVVGDLSNQAALEEVVTGADAVYHLAGFADLNAARNRPLETVHANLLGTVNLLEAMRARKVTRFLFASTVYVYSRQGGFYRCSKQACESYIEEYERTFGLRYTMLRYGSLYGPRADRANGVYRLLASAIRESRIEYLGGPDDVREYIHVEDAARLSVDALAPEFEGQHVKVST
jgi:UDP-glucose 4-epimerase